MGRDSMTPGAGKLLLADGSVLDVSELLDEVLDGLAWAVKVLDYAHAEVHGGRAFTLFAVDQDLDTSDTLVIAFRTPDVARLLHFTAVPGNTSASLFEILEGPTITAGTGSDLTPVNRYRDSVNASGVLDFTATPVANQATLGPTITDDGTVIWADAVGTGRNKGSGTGADRDERILKRDTVYAVRLTGLADNGLATIGLSWYEHTNR